MSLIVIVPTRSRAANCRRLIKSFEKTADNADLLFVTDGDDDTYDGFNWHGHGAATISPRASLVQKLNKTAQNVVDSYDTVMWLGDDHVFVTEHWDTLMLKILDGMGGSGWVYPNDGRRADVPESWMVSADVIRELGYMANPMLYHYYIDNAVAELGRRSSLIRYAKGVVIEHKHYSVCKTTRYDSLYKETELACGEHDLKVFNEWRAGNQVAAEVSRLRRAFNPDVAWIKNRI